MMFVGFCLGVVVFDFDDVCCLSVDLSGGAVSVVLMIVL